jgi:hypothetical protein
MFIKKYIRDEVSKKDKIRPSSLYIKILYRLHPEYFVNYDISKIKYINGLHITYHSPDSYYFIFDNYFKSENKGCDNLEYFSCTICKNNLCEKHYIFISVPDLKRTEYAVLANTATIFLDTIIAKNNGKIPSWGRNNLGKKSVDAIFRREAPNSNVLVINVDLAILFKNMFVFKRWSIHKVTYTGTPSPLVVINQMKSAVGTASPRTIKNVNMPNKGEVLMLLGTDRKIYVFDGDPPDTVMYLLLELIPLIILRCLCWNDIFVRC